MSLTPRKEKHPEAIAQIKKRDAAMRNVTISPQKKY
jgi:hypothetical protein